MSYLVTEQAKHKLPTLSENKQRLIKFLIAKYGNADVKKEGRCFYWYFMEAEKGGWYAKHKVKQDALNIHYLCAMVVPTEYATRLLVNNIDHLKQFRDLT